jgi:Family of unknown function (DUF5681)
MSRRIIKFAPRGADGKPYRVGYKKPPKDGQFRPGQSGNSAGRPKDVRNLATDVRRALKVPVKLKEEGRSRKISTQAGMLMVLREKALKGDARALDRFVELANRFNNEPTVEVAQTVSADDREILAAYAAEIAASTTSTAQRTSRANGASSCEGERVKLRR